MSKEGQCGMLCGALWYGLIYNGGGSLINLPSSIPNQFTHVCMNCIIMSLYSTTFRIV